MKKGLILLLNFGLTLVLNAQVSKTINATAGNLSKGLTVSEKSTVKNITVTGTIDARDFRYLRDSSAFDSINLSAATIVAYTGTKGTIDDNSNIYDANTIPINAFSYKWQIKSIKSPTSTTAIGDYAFFNCIGLTDTIAIPSSVTTIGICAFNNCSGLQGSLTIPLGVSSIKEGTFYNCTSLSGSLIIPQSVTSLGTNGFSGCKGFTGTVVLPNVNYLGDSVFLFCIGLTSAIINSTIPRIGNAAFNSCTNLKSVTFSSSIDTIGNAAFGYSGLETITIPTSVTVIEESAFAGTPLRSVEIPSSVTTIKFDAFYNCSSLQSVSIPSSIMNLNDHAFYNCTALTEISVQNAVPLSSPGLGYEVFLNTNAACILFVPAGSKSAYKTADQWKNFTILEGTAALYLPPTVKDTMVLSQSGKQTFAIKAKGAWHASSNQPWLNVSPADGNGNDSITVTATNLKSGTIRNATISITSAGQPALKVFFTQDTVTTTIAAINNIDAVYPNPATTILHCNAAMGSLVRIYSIEGKELVTQQISADGSIAIDALPKGLYYIKTLNADKQTIVQKFAKQ
jgi:hypothetical protein